jgi:hypothetical protein
MLQKKLMVKNHHAWYIQKKKNHWTKPIHTAKPCHSRLPLDETHHENHIRMKPIHRWEKKRQCERGETMVKAKAK